MKTLFSLLLIIICLNVNAQEKQISFMGGYKTIELGYSYTTEESESIYGFTISAVDSKTASKRANKNDKGKIHEFKGDYVPAAFALIGAKFDDLNIIGKLGFTYVDQTINKEQSKDVFLAAGLIVDYKLNSNFGARASYDSVNAVMIGISLKF